jgi:DNA-binding SARP family transcriptional activator
VTALIAVLALAGGPRPREAIAADLWPDGPSNATPALRQVLWLFRSALRDVGADPDDVLSATSHDIGFASDAELALDVTAFERLLREEPRCAPEAIAMYRGDLVDGLALESLARERERLADLYEDALAEAAMTQLRAGDWFAAASTARTLIARDPLREEAHGVLMGVYGRVGTRSQVHRQYRRLRELLATELDVTPLPETEGIYRRALDDAASSARQVLAAWRDPALEPMADRRHRTRRASDLPSREHVAS